MKSARIFTRAAAFSAALLLSGAAFADTTVWKDIDNAYTISYPDSWRVQTDDLPSTRLRIAAPVEQDIATCRMQVWDDRRTVIYPKRLMDEAVTEYLGQDYWDGEVAGQFDNGTVLDYHAPVSLGNKGDATAVHVSFMQDTGKGKVQMYGMMMASLYGGKRFLGSCSARTEAFPRWEAVFASILDSVELASRYQPFATGYYRDFLSDPRLNLPTTQPGTRKEDFKGGWLSRLFTDKFHR